MARYRLLLWLLASFLNYTPASPWSAPFTATRRKVIEWTMVSGITASVASKPGAAAADDNLNMYKLPSGVEVGR